MDLEGFLSCGFLGVSLVAEVLFSPKGRGNEMGTFFARVDAFGEWLPLAGCGGAVRPRLMAMQGCL
jgi:hypothetical protein